MRSLREREFVPWAESFGWEGPARRVLDTPPALTGQGIAAWVFVAGSTEFEHRLIGLQHADGSWGTSAPTVDGVNPRMWLPDVYVSGPGGSRMFPLVPPEYRVRRPPPDNTVWLMDMSFRFGPDAWLGAPPPPVLTTEKPMDAWSPVTGDIVTVGTSISTGISGVGAGCVEGNRWFTEIPGLYAPSLVIYIRPDGDVLATTRGHVWVLDGETGEPLRSIDLIDEPAYHQSVAYHPGCGLLVQQYVPDEGIEWSWLNDDTLEMGPTLRRPAGYREVNKGWSGTADCGVVALLGHGDADTSLVRLNADGSVRYITPNQPPRYMLASRPVGLADGGTLVMTNPPGWIRYTAEGAVVERVVLDGNVVGSGVARPDAVLAPDGTMYFMTMSAWNEIRFAAVSTGAIPGPYLWPRSGLNWARTNSILPG